MFAGRYNYRMEIILVLHATTRAQTSENIHVRSYGVSKKLPE
jgi:hypothetical protein